MTKTRYPNRIRALIKQAGYTMREVAGEIDIPESTLHSYASGCSPMPHECREKVARLLQCECHELAPIQCDPCQHQDTIAPHPLMMVVWIVHHQNASM